MCVNRIDTTSMTRLGKRGLNRLHSKIIHALHQPDRIRKDDVWGAEGRLIECKENSSNLRVTHSGILLQDGCSTPVCPMASKCEGTCTTGQRFMRGSARKIGGWKAPREGICASTPLVNKGFCPFDMPVRSQINGNNGEWTNGDDMSEKKKGEKHAVRHAKSTPEQKTERRKAKKTKRGAQLTKQRDFIVEAQAEKNAKAMALGKIIHGRGGYTMGGNIGSKIGGWIGDKLHGIFSGILGGGGDYSISMAGSKPSVNSMIMGSGVPAMHRDNQGGIVLSFHEYLGTIDMTEEFKVRTYNIDITDSTTFPWASVMARGYQQWSLRGGMFFLKTLSSDVVIAPTQGQGAVFGSVRYDVTSPPPTSKMEMLNSVNSSSAKPSVNQAFAIECAPSQTPTSILKVRQPGTTPGDLQFYQWGCFDLATMDAANDYPGAMELYLTYDLEFLKPRLDAGAISLMYELDTNATTVANLLKPVADTIAVKQPRVNTIGITLEANEHKAIFPLNIAAGSVWFAVYNITGVVTTNLAVPLLSGSGSMIHVDVFSNQTQPTVQCPGATVNTGSHSFFTNGFFRYTGEGTVSDPPYIFVSAAEGTALPTSRHDGLFMIIQVNESIATGLTSGPVEWYTRIEFVNFICNAISGKPLGRTRPPGEYRLVDWVQVFKKEARWPRGKPIKKAPAPFDITLTEAFAALVKYTGALGEIENNLDDEVKTPTPLPESKSQVLDAACDRFRDNLKKKLSLMAIAEMDDWHIEELHTKLLGEVGTNMLSSASAVNQHLNGAHGSYTGTDDVFLYGDAEAILPGELLKLVLKFATPEDQELRLPPDVDYNWRPNPLAICHVRCQISQMLTQMKRMDRSTPMYRSLKYRVSTAVRFAQFTPTRSRIASLIMDHFIYRQGRQVIVDVSACRYETELERILSTLNNMAPLGTDGLTPAVVIWDALASGSVGWLHVVNSRLAFISGAETHRRSQINGANGEYTGSDDVPPAQEYTACFLNFNCTISEGVHVHKKGGERRDKIMENALRRMTEAKNKAAATASGEADKPRKPIQYKYCDKRYPECKIPDHGHLIGDEKFFKVEGSGEALTVYEVITQSQAQPERCSMCHLAKPCKEITSSGLCLNCCDMVVALGGGLPPPKMKVTNPVEKPSFVTSRGFVVTKKRETTTPPVEKKKEASPATPRIKPEEKKAPIPPKPVGRVEDRKVPPPEQKTPRAISVAPTKVEEPLMEEKKEEVDEGRSLWEEDDLRDGVKLADVDEFNLRLKTLGVEHVVEQAPRLVKDIKRRTKPIVDKAFAWSRNPGRTPDPPNHYGPVHTCARPPRPCDVLACWQHKPCPEHGFKMVAGIPIRYMDADAAMRRIERNTLRGAGSRLNEDCEYFVDFEPTPVAPSVEEIPSSEFLGGATQHSLSLPGWAAGEVVYCEESVCVAGESGGIFDPQPARYVVKQILDDTFEPIPPIAPSFLMRAQAKLKLREWNRGEHWLLIREREELCTQPPTEGTRDVIVYYTVDPRKTYSLYQRITSCIKDHMPFLQQGVGYELNSNGGLTQEERMFFRSNGVKTYTWGLPWSAHWNKKASYKGVQQTDFAYLGLHYFKSCATVPIFDDLYEYLFGISEKRVGDLNGRQFVRRTDKGSCEIVASAISAAKSVALKYAGAEELFKRSPNIFCNTIHHFVQQAIVRGLKDLATATPVTGITFGSWGSH